MFAEENLQMCSLRMSSIFILLTHPFKLMSCVVDTLYLADLYEIQSTFLICNFRCGI